MTHRLLVLGLLACVACSSGDTESASGPRVAASGPTAGASAVRPLTAADLDPDGVDLAPVALTDEAWKERLTDEQYNVLREAGTERAFTGAYWDSKIEGTYVCAGCDLPLFASATKYKSGTGWPSFWQPLRSELVEERTDHVLGYARTEVLCARCEGHLGHVFSDGPEPTGLRYCMNSAALSLVPAGD